MSIDLRWIPAFLVNIILIVIVRAVNDAIAGYSIYLYLGGLFVVFAACSLPFFSGMVCMLLTGLTQDALTGAPFGLSLLLYCTFFVVMFMIDRYMKSKRCNYLPIMSYIVNATLIISLSAILGDSRLFRVPTYMVRTIVDLLASQAAITLLHHWFFDLQKCILSLTGFQEENNDKIKSKAPLTEA